MIPECYSPPRPTDPHGMTPSFRYGLAPALRLVGHEMPDALARRIAHRAERDCLPGGLIAPPLDDPWGL